MANDYKDDVRIVDDATNIRLKELEIEKAKVEARVATHPARMETLLKISCIFAILLVLSGVIGGFWNSSNEKTKRAPELILIMKEETRQLEIILNIARSSKSDELALEAFKLHRNRTWNK